MMLRSDGVILMTQAKVGPLTPSPGWRYVEPPPQPLRPSTPAEVDAAIAAEESEARAWRDEELRRRGISTEASK